VSVTAPAGFSASGVVAGLKSSGAADVALVVNDGPLQAAAGVFTRNRVKAAPVLWSQRVLAAGELHAVVLNAGGANACTGPGGFQDAHATAEHVAGLLGCGPGEVAVCSTGLIGERLPMDRLLTGVTEAAKALADDGGRDAAHAIMTTDSVAKQVHVAASGWSVGGMAKGAGMLAPSLATMLVVLTTDAVADAGTLDAALRAATAETFDRLDSDGSTSTNDTVLLLASGASGVTPDAAELRAAITMACAGLAHRLLADAEGSTKDIAITVEGAASTADAVEVGRAVARDNLVKCAIFGSDPNWGRILAAVGMTTALFDPDRVSVGINGVEVCRDGAGAVDRSLVDMSGRAVAITIGLQAGAECATVLTNDLSLAYVHENSAYST